MKLISAAAGVRRGITAVSGERILLLCPGAPGCTMGALPGAGVSDWPQAVRTLAKSSTTTEVSTCRRPVIIIIFPTAQSLWHSLPVQGRMFARLLGLETMPWEIYLRSRNLGEPESLPSKQHVPEGYNKPADSVKGGECFCWSDAFVAAWLRQHFKRRDSPSHSSSSLLSFKIPTVDGSFQTSGLLLTPACGN